LAAILQREEAGRVIVFTRTKRGADRVAEQLNRVGIRADAIHGNKSQGARRRVLESFKSQRPPVLVATDLAARGIDVDDVSHVFNFDLPDEPETYVHRIGRTGRAGAAGKAMAFCGGDERHRLAAIERLLRNKLFVYRNDDLASLPPIPKAPAGAPERSDRPERPERHPSARPQQNRGRRGGPGGGHHSGGPRPGGSRSGGRKPARLAR
jgi:ATP-dependent RNA helicase RhlE